MQFAEGLTDKQAAQAVAARISFQYALGLKLTETTFDPSVRILFESDSWMVRWKDICLIICSPNLKKLACSRQVENKEQIRPMFWRPFAN